MPEPVLVTVAHGSADARGRASIGRLMAMAAERDPGLDLRVAYLNHEQPSLPQVMGAINSLRPGCCGTGARRVAVATYLLAPGYFAGRIRDLSLAAGAVAISPALGASAETAQVLLDRFREARTVRSEHADGSRNRGGLPEPCGRRRAAGR